MEETMNVPFSFPEKGYQAWADALKPILTDLLGPPAKEDLAPPPARGPRAGPVRSGSPARNKDRGERLLAQLRSRLARDEPRGIASRPPRSAFALDGLAWRRARLRMRRGYQSRVFLGGDDPLLNQQPHQEAQAQLQLQVFLSQLMQLAVATGQVVFQSYLVETSAQFLELVLLADVPEKVEEVHVKSVSPDDRFRCNCPLIMRPCRGGCQQ